MADAAGQAEVGKEGKGPAGTTCLVYKVVTMMYCREHECAEKRAERGKTDGGIWHIHNGGKGHRVGTEDRGEGTERVLALQHGIQLQPRLALLRHC